MAGAGKKRSRVEDQLAELQELASDPSSSEAREKIHASLKSGASLVAARAAKIVRDHAMDGFADDLEAAFKRFLVDAVKSDPGCRAKLATLEALDHGEHSDAAPFMAATRHIQMEPAWGPPVDTAVGVRSRGVMALARLGHPDLEIIAGDLLSDKESPVRQATADALAWNGQRSATGLLLLRWNLGDDDPMVLMACMTGVLALAPDVALARLRAQLFGADQAAREAAIIVLAQSSKDAPLDLLLEYLPTVALAADRASVWRALGLHRSDRALAAALETIATGERSDAEAAIAGLSARRFEAGMRERVEAASGRNQRCQLSAAVRAAFHFVPIP